MLGNAMSAPVTVSVAHALGGRCSIRHQMSDDDSSIVSVAFLGSDDNGPTYRDTAQFAAEWLSLLGLVIRESLEKLKSQSTFKPMALCTAGQDRRVQGAPTLTAQITSAPPASALQIVFQDGTNEATWYVDADTMEDVAGILIEDLSKSLA